MDGRLVGADHPADRRAVVLPRRAHAARRDHGQRPRRAVHERGAPLRRGRAPHVRRRVRSGRRTGREHPVLDGDRPALPQPLRLRRRAAAPTVPRALVQGRRRRAGGHHRGTRREDRRRPATRSPRPSTGSTVSLRSGHDDDFGRGDSGYDRYYGDPTIKPNPCLQVDRPAPYYAVTMVPGDLGTKGGLRTDTRGSGAAHRTAR